MGFGPGTHDVGIVVGNDGNLVHALLLELGEVGEVAGEVLLGAGPGEGTWHRDQNHLLVGELWIRRLEDGLFLMGKKNHITYLSRHHS